MSFYRCVLTFVAVVAFAAPLSASQAMSSKGATKAAVSIKTSKNLSTAAKLKLNKATAKEIKKLKGLNAAKAKAIVAYRKKHGKFKSLDELRKVRGFKRMKIEKLKSIQNKLTLNG